MKKIFSNRWVRLIGTILMSILLAQIGGICGGLIVAPIKNLATSLNNDGIVFAARYATFIGIWIVGMIYFLLTKRNRVFLPKIAKGGKGNNIKTALLIGLPLGIGLNLVVAFAAIMHGDIKLTFSSFDPVMILVFIVCVLIQSGAEELMDRFYLYQKVTSYFPNHPFAPIIANAVVFGLLHIFNPGLTWLSLANVIFVGVLYSLIIYYFDSFWAAVVAHTSWNFCQSILLGLPNSGNVSAYSVFALDAASAKDSFAYNTGFGIEGTVLSTIVIFIACVVIVIIGEKKKAAERNAKLNANSTTTEIKEVAVC